MPPLSNLQLALRGAPFIAFVAGGSYVLSQFTQGTVEARDLKTKSRSVRAFKIEEEHAKIAKKLYGDSLTPGTDLPEVRIPRPEP
mmetsp:Transcript_17778/g.52876  ORF Transcript_17778/g.52876 Transcript_17778/m.52876 type:complete len:85 (-) Transcript_17778:83-337(-)